MKTSTQTNVAVDPCLKLMRRLSQARWEKVVWQEAILKVKE